MTILETIEGEKVVLALSGRLDAVSSSVLEDTMSRLGEVKELVLDFTELAYLSSAGIRCLLIMQKQMIKQNGVMLVTHVNDAVMEIFEMTGIVNILTICRQKEIG